MMAKIPVVFLLLIFPASCSLDYTNANLAETLSSETPDIVIYGYSSVDINDGSPSLKIQASEARIYNSKEETILQNVEFFNYRNNSLSTQGQAKKASINMKNEDADLEGSILVESAEDDSFIKAESLHWVDKQKKLTSDANDVVTIQDKDGSRLSGAGFSADIRRNTILFNRGISGEIISH